MQALVRSITTSLICSAVSLAAFAAPTTNPAEQPTFSQAGPKFQQTTGSAIYGSICAGCHMANGEGARGAGFYPALANNPRLAAAAYPAYVVVNGYHGMPPFGHRLSDEQIAAVLTYVRTSFGNKYAEPVTAKDVADARPKK